MLTPRAKAYILRHIRLAWRYYSEERKAVVKKPCGACGAKPPSLADHFEPVVDPKKGFEDFEVYVFRMFNNSLQPLCKECHAKKTKAEAKERKVRRKNEL